MTRRKFHLVSEQGNLSNVLEVRPRTSLLCPSAKRCWREQ